MHIKTDIVIIGAGMVGLSMAAALAKTGLKIVVLEKFSLDLEYHQKLLSPQTVTAEDFDIRVSAISPGNRQFLQSLGVWQLLPSNRVADYEKMNVWDADGSGQLNFDAADLAQPILGNIVENQLLRAALFSVVAQHSHIKMISEVELDEILIGEEQVDIVLRDSSSIAAQLIIGADGANSATAQHFGINSQAHAYRQQAFVANVRTEKPHQNTAWQRFTRSGPVAFLPLAQPNLCSVVWSIDDQLAEPLKSLSCSDFALQLARAFEHQLGDVELVSEFRSFPLMSRHSEQYLAEKLVLIGDAAHTIHPLAGQGVNLGFQDVKCLSELLSQLLKQQRSFTLKANLRPYERQRKAANTLMLELMSLLQRGYASDNMGVTMLRNFGMQQINQTSGIKNALIRQAMGLST